MPADDAAAELDAPGASGAEAAGAGWSEDGVRGVSLMGTSYAGAPVRPTPVRPGAQSSIYVFLAITYYGHMTDPQDPTETPLPSGAHTADEPTPSGEQSPADELSARLTALEEQVSSLIAALGTEPGAVTGASDLAGPVPGDAGGNPHPTSGAARGTTGAKPAAGGVDPFWALNGLKDSLDDIGGVVFAGYLRKPDGRRVDWQYGRPAPHIESADFADSAAALAALASPIRLALLQAVYNGAESVADLVDSGDFGTTGQIYHHVNQLAAAGWLESPRRGRWTVPVERVIPLLTIILATQG